MERTETETAVILADDLLLTRTRVRGSRNCEKKTTGYAVSRELIAYGLIATTGLIVLVWGAVAWRRHRRAKLRRQGIKHYGH